MRPALIPILGARPNLIVNGDGSDGTTGWEGDANTTVSNEDGWIRATLGASGENPRVYQEVTGLKVGETYAYSARTRGTGQTYFRMSTSDGLGDGNIKQSVNPLDETLNEGTFVASVDTIYIGTVAITSTADEYAEIGDVSIRRA